MPIHSGFSFDLSTSTREPRGMDGGKSAVRRFAEIAVHAYGSVAAHSPERNFGAAQRSRSQSTRPCDCEREHLLTQGDLERQCRVRVILDGIRPVLPAVSALPRKWRVVR
jgi:hypothetical protein